MGTVVHHVTGTCLTYANDSAVKREDTAWQEGRDVWWQDVVPKYPKESAVEWVDAEDTLFLFLPNTCKILAYHRRMGSRLALMNSRWSLR
jgi:hypothetical protein